MPLALSESRYQDIRRQLAEAKLQRQVTEALSESGDKSFKGVDQFFQHLDALVARSEDRPARSRKEGR